ncbi:Hypothetical protein I595_3503 [Croceitalea dokdonensis DOKDO 023]|uniref:Uncharacterized protein n=1 Tax=Croceitalea dokdonensis DOKDO 023 TaxID=1300341 RepID=A0A0P7A216_9FLAO|nr:Hypothetical protein I595_3503 [Croceitalea dokdonensis DOKDO 023]
MFNNYCKKLIKINKEMLFYFVDYQERWRSLGVAFHFLPWLTYLWNF